MIRVERVYDAPGPEDGTRVLVDRLWPRGIAKSAATWTHWMKEVAPSHELRKWFGHDPQKWRTFLVRYHEELSEKRSALAPLLELVASGAVTLLYAARDQRYNHAVALKEFLEAYEDAGVRGLCAEGRWEVAIDAMRRLDLSLFPPTRPRRRASPDSD